MPEYLLGIDFGTKRMGLAIAQTLTCQASALKVIAKNKSVFENIKQVITEWHIKKVIIGLPLSMDGEEQEITRQVKNFGKKLSNKLNVQVSYMDERLTSFESERQFQERRESQLSKAKHKDQIDAMAAQIILQTWLNQNQESPA